MAGIPDDLLVAWLALDYERTQAIMGLNHSHHVETAERNFQKVAAMHHVDADDVVSSSRGRAVLEWECAKPVLRRMMERAT